MFYVSTVNAEMGKFGITDTRDGVTEFYTPEEIFALIKEYKITIEGVKGKQIKVCSASSIVGTRADDFAEILRKHINCYSYETCMEIARGVHFVRDIKGIEDIGIVRQKTFEHLYTPSVQECIDSSRAYTNDIREVDIRDANAVKDALANNVCMVIQHKTNGGLTSFICTGSVAIMEQQYGKGFYKDWFLATKVMGYAKSGKRVKAESSTKSERPASYLNVFSCSLRFKDNRDKTDKEMSNSFYTVNTDRLCSMFILNNAKAPVPNTSDAWFVNAYKSAVAIIDNGTVMENGLPTGEKFDNSIIKQKYTEDKDFIENLARIGYSWGNK